MVLVFPTLIDGMNEEGTELMDNGPFRATHHMFYKSRVEEIPDGLPKFSGKKGMGPMNEEAEAMVEELKEKEKKKEEEKKQKEGGDDEDWSDNEWE